MMTKGQRVTYFNPFDTRFSEGTVAVADADEMFGVEWDEDFPYGHSLGGKIGSKRGWWHYSEELEET